MGLKYYHPYKLAEIKWIAKCKGVTVYIMQCNVPWGKVFTTITLTFMKAWNILVKHQHQGIRDR